MTLPTPFRYQKWKHVRRLKPGPYQNYRRYKPYLREEFHQKCIYCRLPDGLGATFGVEHYWPKERFPQLDATYSNLFYACNRCNSLKRDYWPSLADLKKGIFVPNPCDHTMAAHLWYENAVVETKDVAGEFAESLLDLNDDELVLYRDFIIRCIHRAVVESRKIRATLSEIAKKRKLSNDGDRRQDLDAARADLEVELVRVIEDLRRLTGDKDVSLPK